MLRLQTGDFTIHKRELDGILRLRHQDDELAMGWGGFVGGEATHKTRVCFLLFPDFHTFFTYVISYVTTA